MNGIGTIIQEVSLHGNLCAQKEIKGNVCSQRTMKGKIREQQNLKGLVCSERSMHGRLCIQRNLLGTIHNVPQTEEKSVTPSSQIQEVVPSYGKLLSKVTVGKIPSNYGLITYNGYEITVS